MKLKNSILLDIGTQGGFMQCINDLASQPLPARLFVKLEAVTDALVKEFTRLARAREDAFRRHGAEEADGILRFADGKTPPALQKELDELGDDEFDLPNDTKIEIPAVLNTSSGPVDTVFRLGSWNALLRYVLTITE